jgi:hypothetical protein
MIRIAAILCFSLTLLCPIFCLAEVDGKCSDHDQLSGRNCEAMSVGAVVAKPVVDATPLYQLLPALDFLLSADYPGVGSHSRVTLAAWNRANTKAPPAATRQALLQTFLF